VVFHPYLRISRHCPTVVVYPSLTSPVLIHSSLELSTKSRVEQKVLSAGLSSSPPPAAQRLVSPALVQHWSALVQHWSSVGHEGVGRAAVVVGRGLVLASTMSGMVVDWCCVL